MLSGKGGGAGSLAQVVRALVVLGTGALSSCSLLVDTTVLDEGCSDDEKVCPGPICAKQNDPVYGCERDVCSPCLLENAIPKCDGGRCAVRACLEGWGECDRPGNGCTTNLLVDRSHCGACNRPCNAPCRNGVCLEARCAAGDVDCDAPAGCESGEDCGYGTNMAASE